MRLPLSGCGGVPGGVLNGELLPVHDGGEGGYSMFLGSFGPRGLYSAFLQKCEEYRTLGT